MKLCVVEACARESLHGDGLCGTHAMRRKRGKPLGAGLPPMPRCTVEKCERQQYGRGVCNRHWQRLRRHGDALAGGRDRAPKGSGHTDRDGYRQLFLPDHPNARANGRVCEHVVVMVEHLGRPLLPHETVHHLNGDRQDNRLSNLELWSSSQPPGQRVEDKLAWAREIIALYG